MHFVSAPSHSWRKRRLDTVFIWCANHAKVNLIQRLLSHRHKTDGIPSISWPGESGKEYLYHVYPNGMPFRPVPGNYIYAKETEGGCWIALYIAQTRDLSQRLEGYGKQEQALQNGATHLHVHIASGSQAARCDEERDLILRWRPTLNEVIES